jgi:hypothetical protein
VAEFSMTIEDTEDFEVIIHDNEEIVLVLFFRKVELRVQGLETPALFTLELDLFF